MKREPFPYDLALFLLYLLAIVAIIAWGSR